MADFLENVIEKMINDGVITEAELQERIEEEKLKSPIPPLQADTSFLFYDSMAKDFRLADLEKQNAELIYLIMTGGM